MLISLDTETTGIDFVHGAKPFLVTTCDQDNIVRFWEWEVDPLTREPRIPDDDRWEIRDLMEDAEIIYLQNAQFDAQALSTIGLTLPWYKVRDTLVAGHLLASNHRHDLTSMVLEYLGEDIEPYELAVEAIVKECRAIVKREYPQWKIAREGLPDMPSIKPSSNRDEDKPWKNDLWLPQRMAFTLKLPDLKAGCDHVWSGDVAEQHTRCTKCWGSPWWIACSQYANADSVYTLPLGMVMERLLREQGLWSYYEHRLNLPRIACEMKTYGVTTIGSYTESTIDDYERYSAEAGTELQHIAAIYGHDLVLAEGASLNDNMREFFYGSVQQKCPTCKYKKVVKHWNNESPSRDPCPKCLARKRNPASNHLITTRRDNLNLHPISGKKSGNASLDKEAMSEYLTTLDDGDALTFIKLLADKRKHDTSIGYMQSYRRFWVPILDATGYFRIHPSLNPCGTDHLRWASNSPNLQNVGKQEVRCEECDGEGCELCGGTGLAMLSARNCFGPAPGREWWDMDYQSIEDRIPAYESGEPVLIELFEKPKDPPYWGSNHNLTCSLLWPEMYYGPNRRAETGPIGKPLNEIKDGFKTNFINEYKRGKNTNFAKNYLAGWRKVDSTAQVDGAYERINKAKPRLTALQNKYLRQAEKTGWVETLPTRAIDPKRGYPILASRTDDGRVLSTTPFNYHTSGTACECKNLALIRCAAQCAQWRKEGFDAHVALEVHDSILFDFPRGKSKEENLPRALLLKRLMEQSGEDLIPRIPTPVSVDYHSRSWAKGVSC